MSFQENGLYIVIFPPEGEKFLPNRTEKTRVNITNKEHHKGIRLEVSLDLNPKLQKWCKNFSRKVTIGYQKSEEIEFIWNIPLQAAPGTNDYYLRINFLKSTSFHSFIPKRRQLTILPTIFKPQTNNIEPSFEIIPASKSTKPIPLSSRETLNLEIDVHNRSNKTDNFRISTDLDDAWYVIHYPEAIKRVGAIDGTDALNLNPGEKGIINLRLHAPVDAVAGNYKPEIALHSLNSPELFLKKIVYLHISPQYLLQAELKNILNRVSHKKGQYKISLFNQGNTFRAIEIRAYSSDEDECCEYSLEKSSVRIPPNKTVEVNLEVQPDSKQKRPFLSTKQFNFQVDLIDKNDYPLPKTLPLKSSLFWRSRPLWQLILLFLLALGFIGGAAWLIWKIFVAPPPPPEITFNPEKTKYIYKLGKSPNVAVNWKVKNYESIEKIVLFDKERPQDKINTKCYYFDNKINQSNCTLINQNNLPNDCTINSNTVSCSNIIFHHAQDIKNYTFKLQAFKKKGKTIEKETKEPIAILPIPTLKVFEPLRISPIKEIYSPKDDIKLTFEVSDIEEYFVGEDKIFLLINGERQKPAIISEQNVRDLCSKSTVGQYLCTISKTLSPDGEYKLGIELQSDSNGRIDNKPKRHIIPEFIIVETPIKLRSFTINGSSNPAIEVEPDTRVKISWLVTGKKVEVSLGECSNKTFGNSGTEYITVPEKETLSCVLSASDANGKKTQLGQIKVRGKELPPPPVINPSPVIIPPPVIRDPE